MPRKPKPVTVYREESPGYAARQTFDVSQYANWKHNAFMRKGTSLDNNPKFFIGTIEWKEDD